MKAIYSSTVLADIEIPRIALRDQGIESILENETLQQLVYQTPAMPMILVVQDEDAERALNVIRDVKEKTAGS